MSSRRVQSDNASSTTGKITYNNDCIQRICKPGLFDGAKSGFSLEPARTAPLGGPGNDTCALGTRLYVALTACPAEKVAKFSKVLEKLWTCPDRPGEPSARLSRLLQPAGGTAAAIVCVCQYLPPVRTRREYTAASDPGPLQLVNSDTLFVRGFWSRLTGFAPASRC